MLAKMVFFAIVMFLFKCVSYFIEKRAFWFINPSKRTAPFTNNSSTRTLQVRDCFNHFSEVKCMLSLKKGTYLHFPSLHDLQITNLTQMQTSEKSALFCHCRGGIFKRDAFYFTNPNTHLSRTISPHELY